MKGQNDAPVRMNGFGTEANKARQSISIHFIRWPCGIVTFVCGDSLFEIGAVTPKDNRPFHIHTASRMITKCKPELPTFCQQLSSGPAT